MNKKGITWCVRENGAINHPWYLTIWINGKNVYHQSYKSEDKAKQAYSTVIEELLVEYFELVYDTANALDKIGIVGHTYKPIRFTGTGHDND